MPQPDWSRTLLDPMAVAPHLAGAFAPWRDAAPGSWCVHQSRRRISRKTEEGGAPYLGVAYEWRGERAAPWCYLRAYSRGASAAAAAAGGGMHVAALDAVAYPLPHDPVLRSLPRFLDAGAVVEALPRHADGAAPSPAIVRYEPESHCTARFALRECGGAARLAYGKCYHDERWRAQAKHLLALWPYGETHADAFAVARPLGAYAGLRAVWTEARDGVPLRLALQRRDDAARWVEVLLRGLQHLQSLPPLSADRLDPPALLARTRKQALKLARADAALQPALQPLLASLERGQPAPAPLVNVHGDFHVDQMLASGQRVVLFDFDNLALGHPAHDVADCASQLLTDETIAAPQRLALARGLFAGAADAFGSRIGRDALDWHLRALLVRKAYSFFVRHGADWRERVERALALATPGLDALHRSETRDTPCTVAARGVAA